MDDDDGERGVVRPIGIGIHSYVVSVVLMALDGPSFFGGHFISLVRREIPNLMLRRGGGGALWRREVDWAFRRS